MASSSSRRAKAGGDSIGQFVIDGEIGKGSFAQVYSGTHKVGWTLPPRPSVPTIYIPVIFFGGRDTTSWMKEVTYRNRSGGNTRRLPGNYRIEY